MILAVPEKLRRYFLRLFIGSKLHWRKVYSKHFLYWRKKYLYEKPFGGCGEREERWNNTKEKEEMLQKLLVLGFLFRKWKKTRYEGLPLHRLESLTIKRERESARWKKPWQTD